MSSALLRIYIYHALISVVMYFIASSQFTDNIMLRAGMDMQQFGSVLAVGMLVSSAVNFLFSPVVAALRIDKAVAVGALSLRCLVAGIFLLIPLVIVSPSLRSLGFGVAMVLFLLCACFANNSLTSLARQHVASEHAGRHASGLQIAIALPGQVTGLLCAYYIDGHSHGSDGEFYRATAITAAVTISFIIPAAAVLWSVKPVVIHGDHDAPKDGAGHENHARRSPRLADMLLPFRDERFKPFIHLNLAQAAVLGMLSTFVFPYLKAQGWNLLSIVGLINVTTLCSLVLLPPWGRLADRVGGKAVLHAAAIGTAAACFVLSIGGTWMILFFAALAWGGHTGLFGSGFTVGKRYVLFALSDARRANVYIAAYGLVDGIGFAIGAAGGGWLLNWLKSMVHADEPSRAYSIFFVVVGVCLLLVSEFTAALPDGKPKLSRTRMLTQVFREVCEMMMLMWR